MGAKKQLETPNFVEFISEDVKTKSVIERLEVSHCYLWWSNANGFNLNMLFARYGCSLFVGC